MLGAFSRLGKAPAAPAPEPHHQRPRTGGLGPWPTEALRAVREQLSLGHLRVTCVFHVTSGLDLIVFFQSRILPKIATRADE